MQREGSSYYDIQGISERLFIIRLSFKNEDFPILNNFFYLGKVELFFICDKSYLKLVILALNHD